MSSIFPSNRISSSYFLGHLSDENLVSQAKLGSEQAFSELWSRHGERVRNIVWRIIRNREDAEDLLQEVYLKSFLHLISFKGDSLFSTWLSRIGINLALMLLRKRRNHPEVFMENADSDQPVPIMEFPDHSESIETSYFRMESIRQLRLAIQQLPPNLRCVVELQNRNELPLVEIAHRTGISVAAVKARLVRARATLRELTLQEKTRMASKRLRRRTNELNCSTPSAR
jgi:RNA polymerase sigma factor (sigma-70 family)